MCAIDRIETAGDKPFLDVYGLAIPALGPIAQTNYPSYNRPAVRLEAIERSLTDLHWGLVPHWNKNPTPADKRKAFNARVESLREGKGMFIASFRKHRCLLPATSYVEYREEHGKKIPYEFRIGDGQPYAYAGLWSSQGDFEDPYLSCSMITLEPNELAVQYHDRMPAILRPEDYDSWLNPEATPGELLSLLLPFTADAMTVRQTEVIRKKKGATLLE